jgi:hypothetical protein
MLRLIEPSRHGPWILNRAIERIGKCLDCDTCRASTVAQHSDVEALTVDLHDGETGSANKGG